MPYSAVKTAVIDRHVPLRHQKRMIPDSMRAEFERRGVTEMRYAISAESRTHEWKQAAAEWLSQRDDEERSRNEASQASQARIALDAAKDARSASKDARLAMIITAVGTIISLLAWLFPRH